MGIPEVKLYTIKEFPKLKIHESEQLKWKGKRLSTKLNYLIHTEAIKGHLILIDLAPEQINYIYASEGDMLNVALFGMKAKEWRDNNPNKNGNIRDYATTIELAILSNLEYHNSMLIKEKINCKEREYYKMNSDDILRIYAFSDEEKNRIGEVAEKTLTLGKTPVKNPICVIAGGQSGAGKGGLIDYSCKMFPDGNVIILEGDRLRHFYPNQEQVATLYPKDYMEITRKFTNGLTRNLLNKFAQQGYNLIFHQTLKNNQIADDGIVILKERGYSIVVRGLAVSDFESHFSLIERCLKQIETKGYYRYVRTSEHDYNYKGMPNTVEYIEQNDKYDALEIFKRGKTPDDPQLVYAKINERHPRDVANIITHPYISTKNKFSGYTSAKEALLAVREKSRKDFLRSYNKKILKVQSNPYLNSIIFEQVLELKALINSNSTSSNTITLK